MNSLEDLFPAATNALVPFLSRRLCLLPIEPPGERLSVGSGAFLLAKGSMFIITCAHIARPFLKDRDTSIIVQEDVKIPRANVSLVYDNSDPEVDVALPALRDPPSTIEAFTPEDFANIPDFSKHSFDGLDFLV